MRQPARLAVVLLMVLSLLVTGLAANVSSAASPSDSADRADSADSADRGCRRPNRPTATFLTWNPYDRDRLSIRWTRSAFTTSYSMYFFKSDGSDPWLVSGVPSSYSALAVTRADIQGHVGSTFIAIPYATNKCGTSSGKAEVFSIGGERYKNYWDGRFSSKMRAKLLKASSSEISPKYYLDQCGRIQSNAVPVVVPRKWKDLAVDQIIKFALTRGLLYLFAPQTIPAKLLVYGASTAGSAAIKRFTPRAVYCLIP